MIRPLLLVLPALIAGAVPVPAQLRRSWQERCARMRPAELIDQLRDDDRRWNAESAVDELRHRLAAEAELGASGPTARALLSVLDSTDRQQRDMAAALAMEHLTELRRRTGIWPWPLAQVRRLQRIAVEHLGGAWTWWPGYAVGRAWEFLSLDPATAEADLVEALDGSPGDERTFMAAAILGRAGFSAYVDRIAPILIPHLRDNQDRSDGILALPALYRLGPAVLPWLEAALPGADEQQRKCIELLRLDLESPPRTPADFARRWRLNRISWKVPDPAVEPVNPWLLH
ncbi:MAG: hypothetical protein D6702_03675 [Planctomycetota bacterium]|nr:MAG: hypothetical protein D6702_03675 [Planctomycetota bacterium]